MSTAFPPPSPQDPGNQVGGSQPPPYAAGQPSYAAQPGYQQAQPGAAPGVGAQFGKAGGMTQSTLSGPSPYVPVMTRNVLAGLSGVAIITLLLTLLLPIVKVDLFGWKESFALVSDGAKVVQFVFMLLLTGGSAALLFLGTRVPRQALLAIPGVACLLMLILLYNVMDATGDFDSSVGISYGPAIIFLWLSILVYAVLAALGFMVLLGKAGPPVPALAAALGYGPSQPQAQPGFAQPGYQAPQPGYQATGGFPQGVPQAPQPGYQAPQPGYQATGGFPQGVPQPSQPGYQAPQPGYQATGGFPQGVPQPSQPGYQAPQPGYQPTGGFPQGVPQAPQSPQQGQPYGPGEAPGARQA